MFLSNENLEQAYRFIRRQTPPTFVMDFVRPPGGRFNTFKPTAIVALPADPHENHFESACVMFHEFGHWLDFKKWGAEEQSFDAFDREVAEIICRHPGLQNGKANEYLSRRSPVDEKTRRYHQMLRDKGIIEGPSEIDLPALLEHERQAWMLGLEGLQIGSKHYQGFRSLTDSGLFDDPVAAIREYAEFGSKAVASYERKFGQS